MGVTWFVDHPIRVELFLPMRHAICIAISFLLLLLLAPPLVRAGDEETPSSIRQNYAGGAAGGRVETLVNGHLAHLMIDGHTGVSGSGWSFQGSLPDAFAMFALGSASAITHDGASPRAVEVSSMRLVTGGIVNQDACVSALRLWSTHAPSPALPAEWFDEPSKIVPELYGWHPVLPKTVSAQLEGAEARVRERPAAVYNGRVFLGGMPKAMQTLLDVSFEARNATAVLLKVDAALNEHYRHSRDKSHLADSTDALIFEVQVLASEAESARGNEGSVSPSGRPYQADSNLALPAEPQHRAECRDEMIEGLDLHGLVRHFNRGKWSYSEEEGRGAEPWSNSVGCDASREWLLTSKGNFDDGMGEAGQAARRGSLSRQMMDRDIESVCEELQGLELVWVGDARMRHAFLAALAFFHPRGSLRGYANRHRAVVHGDFASQPWRGQERRTSWNATRKKPPGPTHVHALEDEQADPDDRDACNADHVPYEMELSCAGASPWRSSQSPGTSSVSEPHAWEAGVCGGRAVFRLVESSDWRALAWRLRAVLQDRSQCHYNDTYTPEGSRCYDAMVGMVSTPIASLADYDLRLQRPLQLPPTFLQDSIDYAHELADAISLLSVPCTAPSSDPRQWAWHGGLRSTALVYTTVEPASLLNADHADLNLEIARVNEHTRAILNDAGGGGGGRVATRVPILDSHELMVSRSWCSIDGIHWAGVVQQARVALLLMLAGRVTRHLARQRFLVHPNAFGRQPETEPSVRQRERQKQIMREVKRLVSARRGFILPLEAGSLLRKGRQGAEGRQVVGQDDGVRWSCSHQDKFWLREGGPACRAFVVPPCGHLQGNEEGYWRPELDGTYTWHLKECALHRYADASVSDTARTCLKDRHLLIVGDSVSRYQYLSLAAMLHDQAPDRRGDVQGHRNIVMPGLVWGSWREFYLKSSASFHGRELCDCFRPEGPWSPEYEMRVEENRFFSLPTWNLSVSYLQVFGSFPMHGHFPGYCRGWAGAGSDGRGACSVFNMTKEALAAATHVMTAHEYDSNPELDTHEFFDWHGDLASVLEHVVPAMQVDTLVLNSGLWGELTDLDHVDGIFEAATRSVPAAGGRHRHRCLWKRTTKRFVCGNNDRRCLRSNWRAQEVGDRVPLDAALRYGWELHDAARPTEQLEQDSFADGIHP